MDGRSLRVLLKTLRDNGVTRYKCEDIEIELGAAAEESGGAGLIPARAKNQRGSLNERAPAPGWSPPQAQANRPPTRIKDLESLRMVPPPAAMEVDGDG